LDGGVHIAQRGDHAGKQFGDVVTLAAGRFDPSGR